MDLIKAPAALLLCCGGVAQAQAPSWWPFPDEKARPSAQAALAQPAAPVVAQPQVQAIALPALPVYQQPAQQQYAQLRYVGPGPIRRMFGSMGEAMAGLRRGHYVAEPPPTSWSPPIAAPQQPPIVLLISMPAQGLVQAATAPSPQSVQAATAPPPPPKAPRK